MKPQHLLPPPEYWYEWKRLSNDLYLILFVYLTSKNLWHFFVTSIKLEQEEICTSHQFYCIFKFDFSFYLKWFQFCHIISCRQSPPIKPWWNSGKGEIWIRNIKNDSISLIKSCEFELMSSEEVTLSVCPFSSACQTDQKLERLCSLSLSSFKIFHPSLSYFCDMLQD